MSMYSRPDRKRLNVNAERNYQYAGVTAIWKQYISASAGIPEAGIGDGQYYRQQTITGQFGVMLSPPKIGESNGGAGQIAAGMFQMVSRERIGRQDEIVYNGSLHRVESDPVPAPLAGWWVTQIKRASE
jgi:hypothetical protein